MGSGQAITDPFLGLLRKVFFPNGAPTVTERDIHNDVGFATCD
jgi:hypothetical protein